MSRLEKYRQVFENNRRWVESKREHDSTYFERLASGQQPEFLYIGCADSRVPANEIMGLEPGDVFVHRNVANIVVNTDLNAHTVIEYAVNHLEVDHIIVCGHYGCGGVGAAMKSQDLGVMNGWLREIRDVFRLHKAELMGIADEEARYRRLVELNVQEQCIHVLKTASVQKSYLKRKLPTVHGWVFDLHDGLLKDLEIPFDDILEDIREIYRLDV
ncbi:MAG: carbonic anhydrase [Sandaracinaceae bacterium]|nr:carbonic anhydrase [Sandaracinaceae bacterium]